MLGRGAFIASAAGAALAVAAARECGVLTAENEFKWKHRLCGGLVARADGKAAIHRLIGNSGWRLR